MDIRYLYQYIWYTILYTNNTRIHDAYLSQIHLIGIIRRTQNTQNAQTKTKRRKYTSYQWKSWRVCKLVLELGTEFIHLRTVPCILLRISQRVRLQRFNCKCSIQNIQYYYIIYFYILLFASCKMCSWLPCEWEIIILYR